MPKERHNIRVSCDNDHSQAFVTQEPAKSEFRVKLRLLSALALIVMCSIFGQLRWNIA